jgi:hypothetical protein
MGLNLVLRLQLQDVLCESRDFRVLLRVRRALQCAKGHAQPAAAADEDDDDRSIGDRFSPM